MRILLVGGRNDVTTKIFRRLLDTPDLQTQWYSGVMQNGDDFFLGGDVQMLFQVGRNRRQLPAEPVDLRQFDLSIVVEGDGPPSPFALDGDLRGYQVSGFLAGRGIPTVAASSSDECRDWHIDYGASRTMTVYSLMRDLAHILRWARDLAVERASNGLRGLTLWQPWAWAVANGKDVENRHWTTPYRGLVAFHASAPEFQPRGAYEGSCHGLRAVLDSIGRQELVIPRYEDLPKGVFFAVGRITDCRPHIQSPWYDPLWSQCFQVEDLHLLAEPVPGPTKPLLFTVEPQTAAKILAQVPGLVAGK